MTWKNKRIIVIDDDKEIWKAYQAVLTPEIIAPFSEELSGLLGLPENLTPEFDAGFEVEYANQGKDGFLRVAEEVESDRPFAMAFIDIRMPPGWDGLKTASRIRRIDPNIELVIVTAYSDRTRREIAREVGMPEKMLFFRKPFDPEELRQVALSLTEKWNLSRNEKIQKKELETVLSTSPSAIFTVDADGRIISWNSTAERVTGYSFEEVVGKPCIFPEISGDGACSRCMLETGFSLDESSEITIQNRKGGARIISKNGSIIRDDSGKITKIVESFWDITELKKAQNYVRNVINSMPSVLATIDHDACIVEWNDEAESATGKTLEEVKGEKVQVVLPMMEPHVDKLQKALKEKIPFKMEKVTVRELDENHFKDIVIYPLEIDGSEGAVIRVDDVTPRVRMEEMMIHSEKMLTVGGLAAGMAHEINNPLAGILQNLQVIRNRLSPRMKKNRIAAGELGASIEIIHDYMDKRGIFKMFGLVVNAGKQAARVVDNMLSFSRKSESAFARCNLGELLDKTIELAQNDYDLKKNYDVRKIEIVREYDSTLTEAPCSKSKIQQVILNLMRNAAQAMMEKENRTTTPRIILRTRDEGDMVRIEVEDNGPGIEESVCKRIFEPFFTTKDVGMGTGLGLSVSYFIITESHGGAMTVESAPGKGAKFIIHIPSIKPDS